MFSLTSYTQQPTNAARAAVMPHRCVNVLQRIRPEGPPVGFDGAVTAWVPLPLPLPPQPQTPRVASGRRAKRALLRRLQHIRSVDLDHAQFFSWGRCILSLLSYALLLSDVLRSGLGIRKATLSNFPVLEPDSILHFGPYAYSVLHFPLANLSTSIVDGVAIDTSPTASVWSYKSDTTSVSMRSIAQQLELPEWPPCVMDRGDCKTESRLSLRTVTEMIESLVNAVADHKASRLAAPGHLTVRAKYDWFDRIHHYALPWFFKRSVTRTTQAIHYQHDSTRPRPTALCSHPQTPRPYACDDLWTRFKRLCKPSVNPYCAQVGSTIWSHIESRMATLQASYPNHTLDFVLVEGSDDYSRQGLAFQGRKLFDIVTLTRIRDCRTDSTCTTIAVDDYRYEGASMAINAPDWFATTALIRGAGQVYAWLRLGSLLVGTFLALRPKAHMPNPPSFPKQLVDTLRATFLIPSQVIIYGSVFPIFCYVLAHLMDSAAVYELVALRFNSTLGDFQFHLGSFIGLCAVSMRSMWTLAMGCHVLLTAHTKRLWSPTNGIPGIPEFSITFVGSLTILAQLRSTSWRSTKILQVHEVTSSCARHHRWHTMSYAPPRDPLHKLFFGSTIDLQCLACSLLLFLGIMVVSRLFNRLFSRHLNYKISLFSRTLVPYSASALWVSNSLVVCWNSAILQRIPTLDERSLPSPSHGAMPSSQHAPRPRLRSALFGRLATAGHFPKSARDASFTALSIVDTKVSQQLQRDMQSIERGRSREVEAMVFLVNLAAMTDPLTFLRLRVFGSHLVVLYEAKLTKRRVLLPYGLHNTNADIPIEWSELEPLVVVNTKELRWCELLQCG